MAPLIAQVQREVGKQAHHHRAGHRSTVVISDASFGLARSDPDGGGRSTQAAGSDMQGSPGRSESGARMPSRSRSMHNLAASPGRVQVQHHRSNTNHSMHSDHAAPPQHAGPANPATSAGAAAASAACTSDIQRISSCLRQIQQAEGMLAGARGALSEIKGVGPEAAVSGATSARMPAGPLPEGGSTWRNRLLVNQELAENSVRLSPSTNGSRLAVQPYGGSEQPQDSHDGDAIHPTPSGGRAKVLRTWTTVDHGPKESPTLVDQVVIDAIGAVLQTGPESEEEAEPQSLGITGLNMLASAVATGNAKEMFEEQQELEDRDSEQTDFIPPMGQDVFWRPVCGGLLYVPMVHPEAKIRLAWLMFGFVFIGYEAYAIPVYLAFEVKPTGVLLAWISTINAYFLCDIVFQFLCGYMDQKGRVIVTPHKVAGKYVKSWFIADIVAGIPWEWLSTDDSNDITKLTRGVRFIRAFRLLRLMRLLRIMKLKALLEQVETYIESNQIFTFVAGVMKILGTLFAVTHWGACIWYIIGKGSVGENHHDGSYASWVTEYQHTFPYIGGPEEKWSHYIFSLYFILTTMTTVGYGDITPTNYNETLFAMLLLVVASVVFAMLMGMLTDMIGSLNNQRHIRAEKKMMLSRYMRWRAVPRKLMVSIRQHLLFLWDANEGYDAYEEDIKMQLPPVLKGELCYHIYGRILLSAPFLTWMKDYSVCTKHMANHVQSIFLEKGDHIFRMGQPNEQIYMLINGNVVISRNENLHDQEGLTEPIDPMQEQEKSAQGAGAPPKLQFNIPRQKDGPIVDMKQVKTGKRSSQTQSKAEIEAQNFGVMKTGNQIFDSQVLIHATVQLKREDLKLRNAARTVQRAWRRKLAMKRKLEDIAESPANTAREETSQGKALQMISLMKSKHIEAPAYFGESCLWQPVDEWDTEPPPLYLYSAMCKSRGEFIYIARGSVHDLLLRYSPWLMERFEHFRRTVSQNIGGIMKQDSHIHPMDWAAADNVMCQDDIALQADHRLALNREPPVNGNGNGKYVNGVPAQPRAPNVSASSSASPAVPRFMAQEEAMRRQGSGLMQCPVGMTHVDRRRAIASTPPVTGGLCQLLGQGPAGAPATLGLGGAGALEGDGGHNGGRQRVPQPSPLCG